MVKLFMARTVSPLLLLYCSNQGRSIFVFWGISRLWNVDPDMYDTNWLECNQFENRLPMVLTIISGSDPPGIWTKCPTSSFDNEGFLPLSLKLNEGITE